MYSYNIIHLYNIMYRDSYGKRPQSGIDKDWGIFFHIYVIPPFFFSFTCPTWIPLYHLWEKMFCSSFSSAEVSDVHNESPFCSFLFYNGMP